MNARSTGSLLLGIALALTVSVTQGQTRSAARAAAAPAAMNWPSNGGNLSNHNYSPLAAIDASNVGSLKGVWHTELRGSGVGPRYSGAAQPVIRDGRLFISTGANDVFAVDVESGEIVWTYEAKLAEITTVCCGWVNRGVTLGDGKVFIGQLDGKLVALDEKTGEIVWSVQAEKWEDGFTITSSPLYHDGLVVTGFAGAELGVRGRVKAFDAKSGALEWTFYTVPAPGERGSETWPDNDIWQHGGGTVWQTPAVDPELGLIYFSTGNPGPDFGGHVRPGDNLYTSSVVAIDAKTGEYRWHFQQVHHDLWDYDSAAAVVLFDLEIGGALRQGLVSASKTGWAYILDRKTGVPLIGIEERPVPQEPRQATSPTQPFPVGDAFVPQEMEIPIEGIAPVNNGRIFTPFWTDFVAAKPGLSGGANWPPNSYDPDSGLLYVCASDKAAVFRAWEIGEERPPAGQLYIGGEFGTNRLPRLGVFTAMDMRTNKIVWQQHWADFCYSGSVATGGGLVFVGRNDGRFTALDSKNGGLLWEFQTGVSVNAPPAVFAHGGQQFVAVLAAGSTNVSGPRGDDLWLFGLDGTLGPVPPPGGLLTGPTEGEPDFTAGSKTFQQVCIFCHGNAGEGGHGGPAIRAELSAEEIAQYVVNGGSEMPKFGAVLTPEQIRNVSAQVARMREGR
jgi:alcohol dehydrogenase (cytochrome c)